MIQWNLVRNDPYSYSIYSPAVYCIHWYDAGTVCSQRLCWFRGAGSFPGQLRIESICVVPMSAIGNAVSSYTAQNMGAQQKDRVVQGLHAASKMVIVCAAVICFFLEVYNRGMIGLFIGNEGTAVALSTGIGYLTFYEAQFFCAVVLKWQWMACCAVPVI